MPPSSRRTFLRRVAAGGGLALFPSSAWCFPTPETPATASAWDPFAAPPAVGRMTAHAATILLVSKDRVRTPFRVRARWREADASRPALEGISQTQRVERGLSRVELPLSGLSPGTRYAYAIDHLPDGSREWRATSLGGTFATRRLPGDAFEFIALSDAHWGSRGYLESPNPRAWTGAECYRIAVADGPFDFHVDLGDGVFIERGLDAESDVTSAYLNYAARTHAIRAAAGGYLLLGNHEHESGFHRRGDGSDDPYSNELSPDQHHQAWATRARLLCVPNPRGDTYPEGGEGAPGFDTSADWGAGDQPWNQHPGEPLQNFYAWTWGDALFVVLDPFRYTLVDSTNVPTSPASWTLGPRQLEWFETTLAASNARWKFVLSHHVVGGLVSPRGRAYGRGSAIEAAQPGVEQRALHALMEAHGVQFFLYGHDHAFCHSRYGNVEYLCCPRPTALDDWWIEPELQASYGNLLVQGADKPWIDALFNVLGYLRIRVTPDYVTVRCVRTGFSFRQQTAPIGEARRDWLESWSGFPYAVSPVGEITLQRAPTDVQAVRTTKGARIPALFERPGGLSYYRNPTPPRPESYAEPRIVAPGFPESVAIVDTVPELMYERTFWRNPPELSPG